MRLLARIHGSKAHLTDIGGYRILRAGTLSAHRTRIFVIRGAKVLLDSDLARLYEVETRTLKQAVRRNPNILSASANSWPPRKKSYPAWTTSNAAKPDTTPSSTNTLRQFEAVFAALDQFAEQPSEPLNARRIGFPTDDENAVHIRGKNSKSS
jgi:hypothetical protein